MLNILKFLKGLQIVPKSGASEADTAGEMEVLSSDNKLRVHNGVSSSPVVTESHAAVLTNKTIDANGTGNSISNLETADLAAGVLVTDITMATATDTQIPSALAIKTYVNNQLVTEDDASEIAFAPAGTISATNVQAMGEELDDDIIAEASARATADTNLAGVIQNLDDEIADEITNIYVAINTEATVRGAADTTLQNNINDHINDTSGAHTASAITNVPSGNVSSTNVQSAINELQTDIDTNATNLTNHLADTVDAHDASAISVVPAGNLAATEVQAALVELQTDIDTINTADAETSFTIANNTLSVANVTGLVRSGATYRGFIVDYTIYRKTDTVLSGLAQIGQLRCVYNTQSLTWLLSDDYSGQNSGVTFSITSAGQVQYVSTNITGATYVGTMKFNIRKSFLV